MGWVQTKLTDFDFFNHLTMKKKNSEGHEHIIDNLDDISACSVDC